MGVTTKTVIKAPNPSRPDGMFPIYIRVTIDRNARLIGLKKYVAPEYWDKEQSTVKKGAGNAQKLNFYISREKAKIDQIILDLQNEDKEVTFEMILKLYQSGGKLDFLDFCRQEIALRKGEISPRTVEDHVYILEKLRRYQPKIKLSAIDNIWLTKFEHYLRNTLDNDGNTVATNKKFIRTYYNRAVQASLVKKRDIHWQVDFKDGDRQPLSKAELNALYNLFERALVTGELNDNRLDVLRTFLFPCYAGGLRFSDVCKLRWNKIEDNGHGKLRLLIRTSKTGERVYVPLSTKALRLLPPKLRPEALVFQTYDNKWINRLLEEIFRLAAIKRKATFHYSRHTFATVSLSLKMNKQVIKRIMGIRSDKVMDIYGKIVDDLVEEEMEKWESL